MAGLRETMQKNPMVGWGLAGVLLLLAAVLLWTRMRGDSETAELTEIVTIRCSETGDEWTMPRGAMEKMLYTRESLDASQGLPNPKTGKLTGFPVDAWKETIERIKAEKAAAAAENSTAKPRASPGDR